MWKVEILEKVKTFDGEEFLFGKETLKVDGKEFTIPKTYRNIFENINEIKEIAKLKDGSYLFAVIKRYTNPKSIIINPNKKRGFIKTDKYLNFAKDCYSILGYVLNGLNEEIGIEYLNPNYLKYLINNGFEDYIKFINDNKIELILKLNLFGCVEVANDKFVIQLNPFKIIERIENFKKEY